MRTDTLPGTSTGQVPGKYRAENSLPGTGKNALPDNVNTSISTYKDVLVPGNDREGVSHARVRAQAHDPTHDLPGTGGTRVENHVQHTKLPGTSCPVPDVLPGTGQLVSLIAHAQAITRSNPEIYPLLQNHPGVRQQAYALTNAASAGEDIPTLAELATALNSNLYRIRNAAQPVTCDKFTNGRAKDRFKRDTAQARTTAPSRQEKPMRATAAAPVKEKPAIRSRRIDLPGLLDELDHAYELLKQENASETEVALRAYFQTSVRVGLHWIGGDPYTWAAHENFHGQRLWKLCAWLRGLDLENSQALKDARAAQLGQLRGAAWENYQAVCTPLQTERYQNGECGLDREIIPFTWEGIDTLWQTDEYLQGLPVGATPEYLPKFAVRESEDWHLVCLSVLFLNRACKYALADLTLYPTGDGT